jgi:hypothetical protein
MKSIVSFLINEKAPMISASSHVPSCHAPPDSHAYGIKAHITIQFKHSLALCQDCELRHNIPTAVDESGESKRKDRG